MANDYLQRIAIVAIFVGISSNILSNFLIGILASRGLMNRYDILLSIITLWIIFFIGYSVAIDILSVIESKRPNFVRFMRRCGNVINIVLGVFVSIYMNTLISTINFQAFGFTETLLVFVITVAFLASLQIVLETYVIMGDPRKITGTSDVVATATAMAASIEFDHRS